MTAPVVRSRILRDTYRDSVELMRVAAEVERLPGVRRAALLIATPANCELLKAAGLLDETAAAARPSDLIVAVAGGDAIAAEAALAHADVLLAKATETTASASARPAPTTIAGAVADDPAANLALISTPGPLATAEALKALKRGLHVFLFSNNVSVADELELKRLAVRKRLLLMGPDCGTAILDGVPLGFANVVRRGRIGLVAASGTGLQQVVCLIDRLGEGISQAIGVGGRDLDERIGGLMMLAALERLAHDAGPPSSCCSRNRRRPRSASGSWSARERPASPSSSACSVAIPPSASPPGRRRRRRWKTPPSSNTTSRGAPAALDQIAIAGPWHAPADLLASTPAPERPHPDNRGSRRNSVTAWPSWIRVGTTPLGLSFR